MSSGALFIVCIPTEAAERQLLNGDDNAVLPTNPTPGQQNVPAASTGNVIADVANEQRLPSACKSPRLGDNIGGETNMISLFETNSSPLQAVSGDGVVCNEFQPTPKTHVPIGGGDGSGAGTAAIKVRSFSAAALRCGTRSSDNEVLISVGNGPEEYDNQATVTSIDDFGVGLTTHSAGDRLKRTKSENSLTSPNINPPRAGPETCEHGIRKSWDGYIKDLMSSAKKMASPAVVAANVEPTLNVENHASMETVMREILKKMRIRTAIWQTGFDGTTWQISFSVQSGYVQERLLTMLTEWGIGERDGSVVSMMPCTLMAPPVRAAPHPQDDQDVDGDARHDQEAYEKNNGAWDRFMNSMRARMNVAQIVTGVKQDASITFDFLSLLIIAAVLAAFGLVENSTIFLASSMLISPLMGPIIAATFGTVIKDHALTKFGIINELIGILLTTAVGFVFGLIVFNVDDSFSRGEGLTPEMLSRTDTHSLIVGIFIAIPSGAAVAISILGENIGSLVGVAISASLLPPAVNSGLLWALAVMFLCHRGDDTMYNKVIHTNHWSEDQAVELMVAGSISMAVTLSNVICVYAAGTLFLKIKEVAPIVSREQRQFWRHDVKVARDFNNKSDATGGAGDMSAGANAGLNGTAAMGNGSVLTQRWAEEFADFSNDVERLGRPAYQQTWSPRTLRHHPFNNQPPRAERSLEEFEQMYHNLAEATVPASIGRHFSFSGTPAKIFKRNSPARYRALLQDRIFNATAAVQQRRSSMPFFMSVTAPTSPPPNTTTNPPLRQLMSRFSCTDETAGGRGKGAIKKKTTKSMTSPPSRLMNIAEVSSQGSANSRQSLRSLASTSAAAAAVAAVAPALSNVSAATDDLHEKFERRAAASRSGSGRKFIVTPAVEDPLLDRK